MDDLNEVEPLHRQRLDIEPLDHPIDDPDLVRLVFLVGGRDAEDWASGLYKHTLFSFNPAVHEALTIIARLSGKKAGS